MMAQEMLQTEDITDRQTELTVVKKGTSLVFACAVEGVGTYYFRQMNESFSSLPHIALDTELDSITVYKNDTSSADPETVSAKVMSTQDFSTDDMQEDEVQYRIIRGKPLMKAESFQEGDKIVLLSPEELIDHRRRTSTALDPSIKEQLKTDWEKQQNHMASLNATISDLRPVYATHSEGSILEYTKDRLAEINDAFSFEPTGS